MKVRYQDARRNPTGWLECEASEWRNLPRRPVPARGQMGGQDDAPGWLCNVNIQGITIEGYDHCAVEDVTIGLDNGVKLTIWNDDPDDLLPGERRAIVWTILPLAPDPKLGMAINTRQSCVWYCEGERYQRLVAHPPQNTTVRPWTEFVAPDEAVTRHGVWLDAVKWEEHRARAPQSEWGWRHWCEHLPDSECEVETERIHERRRIPLAVSRRVLKEQRAQGRYHQAEHTITYIQRDTDRAAGWNTCTHEDALELTTASAATESVTTNSGRVAAWLWSTPANEPNSTDWPSGIYRLQVDCTAASAGLLYGLNGVFARVKSDLTAPSLESTAPTSGGDASFSGTGLKLSSSASVDFAAGSATDRYSVGAYDAVGDSHGDAITLQLNTTDSYADGPWEGVFDPATLPPPSLVVPEYQGYGFASY